MLGLAGVELAAGPARLELGALDGEPLTGEPLLVLTLELGDRLGRGADAGGCHGLEERLGDRPLEP